MRKKGFSNKKVRFAKFWFMWFVVFLFILFVLFGLGLKLSIAGAYLLATTVVLIRYVKDKLVWERHLLTDYALMMLYCASKSRGEALDD